MYAPILLDFPALCFILVWPKNSLKRPKKQKTRFTQESEWNSNLGPNRQKKMVGMELGPKKIGSFVNYRPTSFLTARDVITPKVKSRAEFQIYIYFVFRNRLSLSWAVFVEEFTEFSPMRTSTTDKFLTTSRQKPICAADSQFSSPNTTSCRGTT